MNSVGTFLNRLYCCTHQAWVSLCLEVYHKQHSEASSKSTITVLWAASKLLQTRVELGGSPQADARTASGASFHGPGKAWVKFYRPLVQVMTK